VKFLLISDFEELEGDISVILKVRWPGVILTHAVDQTKATEFVQTEQPDMVFLDLNLSQANDINVLNEVRSFSDVPIIIISENDDVIDTVRALEMGADDCLAKPLVPMMLLARVNAVLRRCGVLYWQPSHTPYFISGKLTINFTTREVCVSGKPVKLSPIEYNMLCHLVRNEGRVVTNSSILDNVWGPEYAADIGFIKKYIYRLRSKLGDDQGNPKMLLTDRGIGYKFVNSHSSPQRQAIKPG
jgi:two-component system KDP operon response regulator KdpE